MFLQFVLVLVGPAFATTGGFDSGLGLASLHVLANTDSFINMIRPYSGTGEAGSSSPRDLTSQIVMTNAIPDVTSDGYSVAMDRTTMFAQEFFGGNITLQSILGVTNFLLNRVGVHASGSETRLGDVFTSETSDSDGLVPPPSDNAAAIYIIDFPGISSSSVRIPSVISASNPERTYSLHATINRNSDGLFFAQFQRNSVWYNTGIASNTRRSAEPNFANMYQAVYVADSEPESIERTLSNAETECESCDDSTIVERYSESSGTIVPEMGEPRPTRSAGGTRRRIVMTTNSPAAPRDDAEPRPTKSAR